MPHHCDDLIRLFNACFQSTWRTQLVKGAEEPLYLPAASAQEYHTLFFTRDYFSSALHECAHWFIAGAARRLQVDYGYWYEPDGRDGLQQQRFQQVEVKPQAIECLLSRAAKHPFRISLDNLEGGMADNEAFEKAVYEQVNSYEAAGLPPRAAIFKDALLAFY
jgi:elongation factor P hydroxylase